MIMRIHPYERVGHIGQVKQLPGSSAVFALETSVTSSEDQIMTIGMYLDVVVYVASPEGEVAPLPGIPSVAAAKGASTGSGKHGISTYGMYSDIANRLYQGIIPQIVPVLSAIGGVKYAGAMGSDVNVVRVIRVNRDAENKGAIGPVGHPLIEPLQPQGARWPGPKDNREQSSIPS